MRKRLLTIIAGIAAAGAVSASLGISVYALPAEAGPEAPSLTIRDIPEPSSPNPGPFSPRVSLKDLADFEASEDSEDSKDQEESWPPESEATEEPSESETPVDPDVSENPETPSDPVDPENPEIPSDPDVPENPETPSDPDVPENPENPAEPSVPEEPVEEDTISAAVASIRESLGVLIESNQPFFADEAEKQIFFDNLAAIRRDLDILVYAIIPVAAAVFLIWKFCLWFYRTFVESALG